MNGSLHMILTSRVSVFKLMQVFACAIPTADAIAIGEVSGCNYKVHLHSIPCVSELIKIVPYRNEPWLTTNHCCMFQHAASTGRADPASTYTRVLQSHHGQATDSACRHQAVLSSQQRPVDPHTGRPRQEAVEEGASTTGMSQSERSQCTIIN